jgi:hypothetical protein
MAAKAISLNDTRAPAGALNLVEAGPKGHFADNANLVPDQQKQDKKTGQGDCNPGPCSGLCGIPGGYSALQEVAHGSYESSLLLIHHHVASLLDRD